MSAQLSLTYRPAHLGGEAWQRQLAVLRADPVAWLDAVGEKS